ncbi:MAG: 1,4-dihydroxy-6-naphthoate synthase [Prevotellaceae bacterium]|jgi:1,4-dihydroxy-6-naphthoate synthase|nr:1,4-dihydroxy-6-naphthoate synthase [Prevotellaceae bacterium]
MHLSFSTCPNDTFIFHAMLHGKVDTEGLRFDVHMADVEELNRAAFTGEAEVSKLSYAAFAHVAGRYLILDAGSALGRGNGPLLVAKNAFEPSEATRVAIPGRHTTAAFLLRLAFPRLTRLSEALFSDIPQAVAQGAFDAGVLIHESRFTYAQQGLRLLADLGQAWEQRSGLPIPLGCICIRRDIDREQQQAFARTLRRSVDYALQNPHESRPFVKRYAQELSDEVIGKHIAMFVNEHTRSLGSEGRRAVSALFEAARQAGATGQMAKDIFL